MSGAVIYRRRNGEFGASCDEVADTGHRIELTFDGWFDVWSVHDPDRRIVHLASRPEAERAIAEDWRARK